MTEIATPINSTGQEFDEDGIPVLEAVQDAVLPAIRRFGWTAVNDAMYFEPLWGLRFESREGQTGDDTEIRDGDEG